MGIGYNDSIILYNQYEDRTLGTELFYGTRFDKVRIELTQAEVVRATGNESADVCVVKIPNDGSLPKPYMDPEVWNLAMAEEQESHFTIAEKKSDFIVIVKKEELNIDITDLPVGLVNNEQYKKGFFDFVKNKYGEVYKIHRKAVYNVIPYFEISGS